MNVRRSWQHFDALGGVLMGAKWRIATVCLENVNERLGFSECVLAS